MAFHAFWRTTQQLKSRVCTVSHLLLGLVLGSQVYPGDFRQNYPRCNHMSPQIDLILSQAILLTSKSHLQPTFNPNMRSGTAIHVLTLICLTTVLSSTLSGTFDADQGNLQLPIKAAELDPSCAPGGNFDLSYWELQLPVGDHGKPDTISSARLQECWGYQNASYFFTGQSDGAMVMTVPSKSDGCITTPHSKHCRTELREVDPSSGELISWDPKSSPNRLDVTLNVTTPDDSRYGTVIGQIHIDGIKPVCELYYNSTGHINMGVECSKKGGATHTPIGFVEVGTMFSYQIRYEKNVLSVSYNGGKPRVLSTNHLHAPPSYFKVGNYNQGDSSSDVRFYSIVVTH
jgi:hypothetical protein